MQHVRSLISRLRFTASACRIRPFTLVLAGIAGALMVSACQNKSPYQANIDEQLVQAEQSDTVVVLHGMFRSSYAMRPVEKYLRAKGYEVVNISYPSTDYGIETLAEEYLHPEIANIEVAEGQQIHFVTHSMGGILARYYLKQHPIAQLGRVVMIAPPNQGTELVEFGQESSWIDVDTGPAGKQLSAKPDSWVRQLGPVEFETGVIAGNKNGNWITSALLPGPDDGVVSVESTKLDNMKDFVTVPEKHYKLRGSQAVLQQAAYFLKFGSFLH